MTSGLRVFLILFRHGLRTQFNDPARLLSPLLFALTFLLMFSFAMGTPDPALVPTLFTGLVMVTLLFVSQLTTARILDPWAEDQALTLVRTELNSLGPWWASIMLEGVATNLAVALPSFLLTAMFMASPETSLIRTEVATTLAQVLIALVALGVMTAAITLRAAQRAYLFPLIYFPLSFPVLLAGVHMILATYGQGPPGSEGIPWVWILVGTDVIYVTLSWLLFDELLGSGREG